MAGKEDRLWCPRLSREDTTALKAAAMFLIVAHNFLHNIQPVSQENEFVFHILTGIWQVIAIIVTLPGETVHALLAYFGHYGVQVFIVLSGYGLTKKVLECAEYPSDKENGWPSAKRIFKIASSVSCGQILKMLKLIAVASPAVALYEALALGYDWLEIGKEFLQFITFTNNLNPSKGAIWGFVSVWWFFALIVQLYLLFPIILAVVMKKPGTVTAAVFASLAVVGVFYDHPWVTENNLLLFSTPLSHAAVFGLGIAFALGRGIALPLVTLCPLVFLSAQFIEILFPISHLCAAVVLLFAYDRWGRKLTGIKPVMHFGAISMFIFVVHGILRHPWTDMLKTHQETVFSESGSTDWILTMISFVCWFGWILIAAAAIKAVYEFVWQKS